ncbi:XI-H [Symbiodinium microadriaticum]|nr:XI-H [Symbiodinium microadriaticum]
MFAGVESAFRQEWGLSGLDAFRYTNQSGEYNRHDGESDEENYRRLERAMKDVGLDNVDKEMIFRIIAGILHLGNVTFAESTESGSDAATFSPQSADHLKQVCCLLGVSECDMLIAMSKRSFLVAGCEIHKSLNVESAASARDAMAKTLYDMMFKWMVNAVNETLYTDSGLPASTIAVLDIFGFEYFQINSFEQLCINYANEKLQDHFNYATFESRQEMYLEEGLQWTVTNYPDNSERLDMFEHKTNGIEFRSRYSFAQETQLH